MSNLGQLMLDALAPTEETTIVPITPTVVIATEETPLEKEMKNVELAVTSISHAISSLGVRIFDAFAEIEVGEKVKKQISIEDLQKILQRAFSQDVAEVPQVGLQLPSNTIFLSTSSKQIKLMTYYSGEIRPMKYDGRLPGERGNNTIHDLKVVTPNIVLAHTLNKEAVTGDWIIDGVSKYYATDLNVPKLPNEFIARHDHRKRIWRLPMTNIYEEGRMCYGNNSMPARFSKGNLRGLDYYFKMIWESPFNDDLGVRSLRRSGGEFEYVNQWYKYLSDLAAENKPYPYEKLTEWTPLTTSAPSA